MRLKPGYVLTAEARQWQAERQQRLLELETSPMGLWDRATGGHLRRELQESVNTVPKEVSMNPADELVALVKDLSSQHAPLVRELRKWTPAPRPPGQSFDPSKSHHVALDGTELGAYPAEHVERQRKQARSNLQAFEAQSQHRIAELVEKAAREPASALQLGTRLDAAGVGATNLLVQQYRDLTKQQRAELDALGVAAAERGDLQEALQYQRAAQVIHEGTPGLDEALTLADPVRRTAKAELERIERLVTSWSADMVAGHVQAGIASTVEQVQSVSDPHDLGMRSVEEGAPSYVEQATAPSATGQ